VDFFQPKKKFVKFVKF